MSLFPVTLFLMYLCGSEGQELKIAVMIQKKVAEIFSRFAVSTAPLFINLDCDLEHDFVRDLVASQLSLSVSSDSTILTLDYSRVFSTTEEGDRFLLDSNAT